jgi:hypothetical protein
MTLPSKDQVLAALRHLATYSAGVGTAVVALGAIDQNTASNAVAAFQDMLAGLQQAVGAGYKLAVILGPVVGGLMAWFAGRSASLKNRLGSIARENPDTIHVDVLPGAPAGAQAIADTKSITNVLPVHPFTPPAKALTILLLAIGLSMVLADRAVALDFDHPKPVQVLGVILGVIVIAPADSGT